MDLLKRLSWIFGSLAVASLLTWYGHTHHPSPFGVIMTIVVGFVVIASLSVMLYANGLVGWMRFGVIPVVATLVAVVVMTGKLGSLTTKSLAEVNREGQERYDAMRIAASTSYTSRLTLDPLSGTGLCVPSENSLPPGVTVEYSKDICFIAIDWKMNNTLAVPTKDGKGALGKLNSLRPNQDKLIVLTFPTDIRVDVFFYNRAQASKAVPLPLWVKGTAHYKAMATQI